MPSFRLIGLFAIVPTTILLTISFFVLFVLRKADSENLKTFGYIIVALLWISAALIFGAGVYTMTTGCHPIMPMMQEMMRGQLRQSPMMQRQMMNR